MYAASPALQTKTELADDFPLSVWNEHKLVTQIPWTFSVSRPSMRLDFRQELQLVAMVRSKERQLSSGDVPDLVLFARVLENEREIESIHSVSLREQPEQETLLLARHMHTLIMPAIARPGKYRLEAALLNRETGQYSTRYENVTINGKSDDLLERALEGLTKFEFAGVRPPEIKETVSPQSVTLTAPLTIGLTITNRGGLSPRLNVADFAISSISPPRLVIDRPGVLKLTVFSVLSPTPKALEDESARRVFDISLANLLSAFTRFDVIHGSSDLLALDLWTRTRAFDRVNLKEVQLDALRTEIGKDRSVVSLKDLSDRSDRDDFLREALAKRLHEAEADTTSATHAIIVVGARRAFRDVTPIPSKDSCHCRIFYVRFALSAYETDDMPRWLSAYKPRIFEPSGWPEFRDDFNTIYEQLAQ
jgi:hypothetical protein